MKALVYVDWETIELQEFTDPSLSQMDEAIVKVAACGICGSELESFKSISRRRKPPIILGHEFCGEIVDISTGGDFRVGDRVIVSALVPCRKCQTCHRGNYHLCPNKELFGMHRNGAFAEYVSVPIHALYQWPDSLPANHACLTEPLGNGVHVVSLTRHTNPQNALVIGAGPIGLMCQQALQVLMGTRTYVTDTIQERLDTAKMLGASATSLAGDESNRDQMLDFTKGEGFDVVVDAAGTESTKAQSIECLRPGGCAVWLGLGTDKISLNSYGITLGEKQVLGTYSANQPDYKIAIDLLKNQKINLDWIDRYTLDEGEKAFRTMLNPQGNHIKAILNP
ncbi:MAG: zinc-binding dehydrogenase [Puniceicoccaceae bacterium]